MPEQLIYTSARRGLDFGRSGYCTVARSSGMRKSLILELESLSKYDFQKNTESAIYSYRIVDLLDKSYHICSMIANCGFDYTGRTNFIAHHVAFTENELAYYENPANFILNWKGWKHEWGDAPRELSESDFERFSSPRKILPATTWERFSSDAANAAFIEERGKYTINGVNSRDYLKLLSESLATTRSPWGYSFTTRLQNGERAIQFSIILSDSEISGYQSISPRTFRLSDGNKKAARIILARTGELPKTSDEKEKSYQNGDKIVREIKPRIKSSPQNQPPSVKDNASNKYIIVASAGISLAILLPALIYFFEQSPADKPIPSLPAGNPVKKSPMPPIIVVEEPVIVVEEPVPTPSPEEPPQRKLPPVAKPDSTPIAPPSPPIHPKETSVSDAKGTEPAIKNEISKEAKLAKKILGINAAHAFDNTEIYYLVGYTEDGEVIDVDIFKKIKSSDNLSVEHGNVNIVEKKSLNNNNGPILILGNENSKGDMQAKCADTCMLGLGNNEKIAMVFLHPNAKGGKVKLSEIFDENFELKPAIKNLFRENIKIRRDYKPVFTGIKTTATNYTYNIFSGKPINKNNLDKFIAEYNNNLNEYNRLRDAKERIESLSKSKEEINNKIQKFNEEIESNEEEIERQKRELILVEKKKNNESDHEYNKRLYECVLNRIEKELDGKKKELKQKESELKQEESERERIIKYIYDHRNNDKLKKIKELGFSSNYNQLTKENKCKIEETFKEIYDEEIYDEEMGKDSLNAPILIKNMGEKLKAPQERIITLNEEIDKIKGEIQSSEKIKKNKEKLIGKKEEKLETINELLEILSKEKIKDISDESEKQIDEFINSGKKQINKKIKEIKKKISPNEGKFDIKKIELDIKKLRENPYDVLKDTDIQLSGLIKE